MIGIVSKRRTLRGFVDVTKRYADAEQVSTSALYVHGTAAILFLLIVKDVLESYVTAESVRFENLRILRKKEKGVHQFPYPRHKSNKT